MGRKRWIFEETGEERVPEVPGVFPAGRFDYEFVLSVGGWPVYFSSGDKGYPTRIIKLVQVEDVPTPEEEKVMNKTIEQRVDALERVVVRYIGKCNIDTPFPTSAKLLPCPFCGGDFVGFGPADLDGTCVSCGDCGVRTRRSSEIDARAAWNRRVTP